MARYFLDLHECEDITRDPEGIERAGIDEVRAEARRAARAVMCGEMVEGRLCLSCSIEVRDEAGNVVLSLPFREAVTVTGL